MPDRHIQFMSSIANWQDIAATAESGDGNDANHKPALRRFSLTAYTGGPMLIAGWDYPVVVDLAGLKISAKPRPILKDHKPALIVGHSENITKQNSLLSVAGIISGSGRVAQEVVEAAANGFPWQVSIGARVLRAVFIPQGRTAKANGREIAGPAYIARKAQLGEISFVALGADDDTEAHLLAASASHQNPQPFPPEEIISMEFETWISAQGFVLADLSDTQRERMQALFEAQQAADIAAAQAAEAAAAQTGQSQTGPAKPQQQTHSDAEHAVQAAREAAAREADQAAMHAAAQTQALQDMRSAIATESERIDQIRTLCAGKHSAIEAKAIREGWDVTKTELTILRSERPEAPAVHSHAPETSSNILEAACILSAKLAKPEDHCKEQDLDAADKRFRGGIGLQELLLEAAWANGFTGHNFRDRRAILQAAFRPDVAAAGLSTIDMSGILSNVANKFLLEGFQTVEQVWREISAIRSVVDFKAVTSYRLIGAQQYERVAPGGEIKHGELGEESYQNRADTHGLLLSIDRRDIINDDLGALTQVPRMLGRGAGLKINDVFWTVFMANQAFFKAANKNYIQGADSALGIDGLTKAETAFLEQVGSDGKPMGATPALLLVPPSLIAVASQLHKSLELRQTTADAKYPVANPHQGKFRSLVSRYLSNSHYAGHSTKAWYLLADPRDVPVIETAFLNGQESPVIETADADFHNLGIQMRGYHDFGANLQEPRGGVKAKGAA